MRARIMQDLGDDTVFKLVCERATPEQWSEWLRAPLEDAAATANHDELVRKLLRAGANGGAGWRGCHDNTLLLHAAAERGDALVVSCRSCKGQGRGQTWRRKLPAPAIHLSILRYSVGTRLLQRR
ncbi:unnamed protein product [Ectocarpus sp. 4 AP-2014]